MFSGIQEILVLVLIILGILFLPRILSRGPEIRSAMRRPRPEMTGKMRIALSLTVLWPAVVAAFMQPWQKNLSLFLYIALGPVALSWMVYWVMNGFKRR